MIRDHQILHFPHKILTKDKSSPSLFVRILPAAAWSIRRRTARRRGRIRMAGRCPEGHGPARRGSRAEREQESPCPWVTQHLQRDRTEDQGQPTWEEMLLGEPPHLSASSSLIPAGPTTWQRPAASSASPAKLLPRRQRPLGLLTPQAAWPRSIFFLFSPCQR